MRASAEFYGIDGLLTSAVDHLATQSAKVLFQSVRVYLVVGDRQPRSLLADRLDEIKMAAAGDVDRNQRRYS